MLDEVNFEVGYPVKWRLVQPATVEYLNPSVAERPLDIKPSFYLLTISLFRRFWTFGLFSSAELAPLLPAEPSEMINIYNSFKWL